MKWMARGDWAHWIGLVRYAIALANHSKSISMWEIPLSGHSEFRKLVMFMALAQQPVTASRNGWHQDIEHIEQAQYDIHW